MEEKHLGKVFSLTLFYFFIEFIGGIYYHSLALLTDSLFMVGNITGQFIALLLHRISKKPADNVMTFGYERVQVISALINGFIVGIMIFYVWIEAYKRFLNPQPIAEINVLFIAVIGFFVNIINIFQLIDGKNKIHIKGVLLAILNDFLGSVSVLISTILIYFTGFYVIDAITGFLMSLLIAYPVYHLVKESFFILLDAAPFNLTKDKLEEFIKSNFPFVKNIRNIHIWQITQGKTVMVGEVEIDESSRDFIYSMKEILKRNFNISEIYLDTYGGKNDFH